jgi:hypothetical protein
LSELRRETILVKGAVFMRGAVIHRSRSNIYLLTFLALLIAGAVVLAAAAHTGPATTSRASEAAFPDVSGAGYLSPEPLRDVSAARQQAVEAEVIALRPSGFEPAEITRPAGRVLMAVSDQSGLENAVLRLTKEGDRRVQEVRLSRRKRLWRKVVDLAPGDYILTEASHPEWACRITVTR